MSDPAPHGPLGPPNGPPGPPNPEQRHYRLAIRRPVSMAMIFLTLVVFGWKSYQQLPINLMPDISYPSLTVRSEYEGAAPEDVEKLLTRPLEETLSIVSGMVEISSVSKPGLSEIVMEFTWGTDMNTAQQDVRDRLDLFMPPREVTEKPVILRYDPTLDPVMRLAITGSDQSGVSDEQTRRERGRQELTAIREAAERHIKSDLEGEIGIAQVLPRGGREEEIQILVDSERLKGLGLSLQHIVSNLAQQNINLSGGKLKEGKTEYLVRTLNEFQQVGEIQDTILGITKEGRQIRLADVAKVALSEKEQDTIVRINGREAVELAIYKWGDANTVQVCNKLKDLFGFERNLTFSEQLAKDFSESMQTASGTVGAPQQMSKEQELAKTLRSRLPEYAELHLVSDQSRFILGAINEVQNSAIMGGVLAVIVLYFFLREMKSTLIVAISIPISVIATFIPMFMRHISLNIMSLGGLALGVGMLVDNSIVVMESIFRCREEGDDLVGGADRGTHEVAGAVTSSTLTTVAVFFPIAFVEGVAGQLFRDQALTVTFSLMASLAVALYLNPMIASRQKWSLVTGQEVIWVLTAYRDARAGGAGAARAVILTPVYAVGRGLRWFRGTCLTTFRPLVRLTRGIFGKDGRLLVNGVLKCGIPALPLLTVALLALFGVEVFLAGLASILITLLLIVSCLVWGVVWLTGKALSVLLWLPLKVFNVVYAMLAGFYIGALRRALVWSPGVLVLILVLAAHAGFLTTKLGRELIPPMKQGEFGIRMEAPPGTRLEETDRQAQDIERLVLAMPEVETVAMEIGQEKTKTSGERGENVAQFTVNLGNPAETSRRQDDLMNALRREVASTTSNTVTFTLPTLFSFKTAVEVQIRGDDLKELKGIGQSALAAIADVPGLKDAELSIQEGYPEIVVEPDRDLLAAKGLTPDAVAQRLHREVQGDVATRFNRGGTKIDIRVRSDKERLASLDDLRKLSVVDGSPPSRLTR